jgi:hypothetical protein
MQHLQVLKPPWTTVSSCSGCNEVAAPSRSPCRSALGDHSTARYIQYCQMSERTSKKLRAASCQTSKQDGLIDANDSHGHIMLAQPNIYNQGDVPDPTKSVLIQPGSA